ncbi:uncharacterized protein M6B38_127660 [Iris pallida]|uniref:SET domain-containing protein n=1 Tax=Iris pallida TaxID=29817 RepID=A0AAX6G5S9_IRIPA|nr:uncharacterized protein M6B38_127660 [Iris pallida]
MAAASSSPPPPPLVQVADLPGRGRSLIATRHIKPGEILLSDSPLLLYPSSPAASDAEDHAALLRAAHSLSLSSPSSFHQLLSLHAGPTPPVSSSSSSPFPPSLTATLLAVDRSNAFALADARRRVSAYAIYPLASFFNHDCLPNACRFDYPDRGSADLTVRALHDIPPGREVCLSYFPVNWGYKERQARLLEDYGFRCECDRCRVEANWKDDEENMEEDGGDEGMAEEEEEEEEGDGDFPHAYFFVKFVCDVENCGGTLAPLPPSDDGTVSDVLECNVCGKLRKEGDEDGDGEMDDD